MIKAALKTYCFVLLAALMSCRDNHALQEAEALLETNPAAADSVLVSMPEPTSNRDRAWYAVLKTQADYKQYKPILSDSLILMATKYYGSRHKNYRSAMAWYIQGCVYKELKKDVPAIDAFLKSKDLFPDTLVRYYALVEQKLGRCYLNKGLYDESCNSFLLCRNNACRIKDSTMMAYADYNIALTKLYSHRFEGLNRLFGDLSNNKYLSDFYREESLLQLAKYHIYSSCLYDSANYYLNKLIANDNVSLGATYNLKGKIFNTIGNKDSAFYYYKLCLGQRKDIYTLCDTYKRLSQLSLLYDSAQEAFRYSTLYAESMDSIMTLRSATDVARIEILHYSEMERQNRKEMHVKTITISTAVVFVLLIIFILLYQSYKNRVNANYINFCDNVWTKISTTLSTNSTDSDYLLFCKTKYLNSPSHFILMSPLHEKYNREEKDAIKHDINVAFSDLMAYMLNKYPSINNKEVQLCILNSLGTEKIKICQILDLSDDSFRKQKSRLKEKLGDSYALYFG